MHYKHNYYHLVLALLLSKLYSNSLLVLLNNRVAMRNKLDATGTLGFVQDLTDNNAIQLNIDRDTFADDVAMVDLSQVKASSTVSIVFVPTLLNLTDIHPE